MDKHPSSFSTSNKNYAIRADDPGNDQWLLILGSRKNTSTVYRCREYMGKL